MSQISQTYALRRFSHSTDPDFRSALGIYVTNITPDSRTNSNEITYWLDRYKKEYRDELCVCGFYLENKIIGFTEFVFFKEDRLIVFDYLVLHKSYRTHGEYYQFTKMIQNWVDEQGFEFDFAVAEVSYESSNAVPSERSVLLVELFKQMGFSVAACCHYQAPLGLDNPQSDMRAHLLITTRERINSVKRETLLSIVNTIYFKHNERWYQPLLDNPEKYHDLLAKRFCELKKQLDGSVDIELNGIKIPTYRPPPKRAPNENKWRKFAPAFAAALFVWLLCLGLIFLQDYFRVPIRSLIVTVIASLVIFVAVFALFDRKGQRVLDRLLDFIIRLCGKRK